MFILSNAVNMWFQKLMRQFFMGIDGVVFNLISSIYDLLISIARTSVLSQADILEMADKIYNLLTVFMVFKVILSLITYVVNPDDFSDKTKGISKLGTNIVISLGLLILTPYIFNYAYRFQTFILEDNTLTNLIFETSESNNDTNNSTKDFFNTAGDQIAFMAMVPFFTPNTAINELQTCVDLRNDDGSIKEECRSAIETVTGNSSMVENYNAGFQYENLGLMFRQDIGVAVNSEKMFVIDYKYIFSTVVGVVIVLLLLTFCMDVALRSIKLAFLQLIAPIPILSYVDPKSGKDGMFKKWYQLCFKTFLSLFIRLIALYFAVYIISKVDNMVDIVDGTVQTNFLIKIFIIIGALMFAKDLPKILEGLGIKLDGGGKFTLNPIKKFTDQAMGGKKILGFAGAAGAAGLAGATNLGSRLFNKNNWKNKDGKVTAGSVVGGLFKAAGSSVAGTTSAAFRGSGRALKGEGAGKVFTNSYSGAMKAKHDRSIRQQMGVGFFEALDYKVNAATGNLSYSEMLQNSVKDIENGKGSKEGFTTALQKKYGIEQGKKISDSLDKSIYIKQSNKELETAKKVQKAKQDHVNAVMSGKDKIEGIAKDRGDTSKLKRALQSVESVPLTDYIKDRNMLVERYESDPLVNKFLRTTDESEQNEILMDLAKRAKEEDRSKAKKELDTEIAKTVVSDLSDPNRQDEAMKVFKDLYTSVLSTDDAELIMAFEDQFKIDKNNPDIDFKRVFTDNDGNKLSDDDKINKMSKIIDSFGTKGIIQDKASSVRAKASDTVETIDLILDARGVQVSDIQNSEEARHQADIASTVGKK